MRYIFLIMMLCPCEISASNLSIQEMDEWLLLASFGAPCTTRMDIAEGTCDLKVRWKPRIRRK